MTTDVPGFNPILVEFVKKVTAKRAKIVIDHILQHGKITTEELKELYGYDHPPRAAGDVKELGIPLVSSKVVSNATGRKISAYTFGDPKDIKHGRLEGRKVFPKSFKRTLIEEYGEKDGMSGAALPSRYLQIDHRIPYQISGENDGLSPKDFMLLDASSQRAKSWSCEHCPNFNGTRDKDVCRNCYWASPEAYTHVATKEVRRVDLQFDGDDVALFDRLKADLKKKGGSIDTEIKNRILGKR